MVRQEESDDSDEDSNEENPNKHSQMDLVAQKGKKARKKDFLKMMRPGSAVSN